MAESAPCLFCSFYKSTMFCCYCQCRKSDRHCVNTILEGWSGKVSSHVKLKIQDERCNMMKAAADMGSLIVTMHRP